MKWLMVLLLCLAHQLDAALWKVGPARTYKFCSQVESLVADGDTVDIDAADYTNDRQVQWTKNRLLIRGTGVRPRLFAGSIIANDATNGKGIFVVKGNNCVIENIEFRNAKVQSHNGAGVRQEGLDVVIRYCVFNGNEMGVLAGGYIPGCTIIIEFCEFLNGGSTADPGYQHNIYINHVDTFIFRYNYSHDAIAQGHELKSRADKTFILYNRISNIYSDDSRNIDIPNGGTAVVLGNIIEQSANSTNTNLLGYGLEGLINPGPHNLWVCHNTFVNKHSKGSFVHVAATGTDTLMLRNNIMAGPKTGGLIIGTPGTLDSSNNLITDLLTDVGFAGSSSGNYRLLASSRAVDAGKIITRKAGRMSLNPGLEYLDTCKFQARPTDGKPDLGAFEYPAPLGVGGSSAQLSLHLYPNPGTELGPVDPQMAMESWFVMDIRGKELRRAAVIKGLETGSLPAGTYIVGGVNQGRVYTGRWVKLPLN